MITPTHFHWSGRVSVGNRLYLSFGAMLAILLTLAVVGYRSFCWLAEVNRGNIHSYQTLMEIRSLTSNVFYLKREARSFANTHSPRLVEVIETDRKDLDITLMQTARLTATDVEQQVRLHQFNTLYQRWLKNYLQPLLLNAPTAKQAGKQDMEAMRDVLKAMKQAESNLLERRAERVSALQKWTAAILVAGVSFAIVLALGLAALLAKSAGALSHMNQQLQQEVTERSRAQEALRHEHDLLDERVRQRTTQLEESRQQLRSLAAHVEAVREEENTRIAREIHDQLGQALTGLKMDLAWLDKRLGQLAPPVRSVGLRAINATMLAPGAINGSLGEVATQQAPLRLKIASMFQLIDNMTQLVSEIASSLRPALLDDVGLLAAIEWQAQDFQERSGIVCQFVHDLPDTNFSPELATGIFRVLQEALTNVVRHAGATQVVISLSQEDGALLFEVSDNGCGLKAEDVLNPKSLGLLGMKERALLLDGRLSLSRAGKQGTCVCLELPPKVVAQSITAQPPTSTVNAESQVKSQRAAVA